jgi:hypothetical protein
MKKETPILSREKHLDHMVRMLPFLTLSYLIHAYALMHIAPVPFTKDLLLLMALTLIAAVLSIASYDLHHALEVNEDHLVSHYHGWFMQKIYFQEIKELECVNQGSTFGHLKIHLVGGKALTIYFLDAPEDIKKLIQKAQTTKTEVLQAA